MEKKIPVSVVIITKDEEKNIAPCLESVKWADEIIVVDDYSSDKTVEIAQRYTEKVIQRKMDVEGRHRNWAYAQAKNKWVLSLDADERVTPELKDEISGYFNHGLSSDFKGYTIPRRNYIGDYWVRYGGWYPSPQLKFFDKDNFKWEEVEVHPRAFLDGACGRMKNDIVHYSYKDFGNFLYKINSQTTWEAKKWVDDKREISLGKALWRAIDRFFRGYIRKKGYKDGFIGFMVGIFASLYQVMSYAKYWEAKKNGFK